MTTLPILPGTLIRPIINSIDPLGLLNRAFAAAFLSASLDNSLSPNSTVNAEGDSNLPQVVAAQAPTLTESHPLDLSQIDTKLLMHPGIKGANLLDIRKTRSASREENAGVANKSLIEAPIALIYMVHPAFIGPVMASPTLQLAPAGDTYDSSSEATSTPFSQPTIKPDASLLLPNDSVTLVRPAQVAVVEAEAPTSELPHLSFLLQLDLPANVGKAPTSSFGQPSRTVMKSTPPLPSNAFVEVESANTAPSQRLQDSQIPASQTVLFSDQRSKTPRHFPPPPSIEPDEHAMPASTQPVEKPTPTVPIERGNAEVFRPALLCPVTLTTRQPSRPAASVTAHKSDISPPIVETAERASPASPEAAMPSGKVTMAVKPISRETPGDSPGEHPSGTRKIPLEPSNESNGTIIKGSFHEYGHALIQADSLTQPPAPQLHKLSPPAALRTVMPSPSPIPQAAAASQIAIRLDSNDSAPVELRIRERGGEVQIAVRSSDPSVATDLRQDLSDLVKRLQQPHPSNENSGPHLSSPGAVKHELTSFLSSESPTRFDSFSDDGQSQQQRQRQQQQHQRQQPSHAEPSRDSMDEIHAAFNEFTIGGTST